jgi:polyphenol oxidase
LLLISEQTNGLLLYRFQNISSIPGATHGVFSRLGGGSAGVYQGLNISFGTGDDPAAVTNNRMAMYAAAGAEPSRVIVARQVHSDLVLTVTSRNAEVHNGGWRTTDNEGDGLITSEHGLFLQMSFGDCTPLLFFDPVRKAIGIAHAGWKGTLARIGARVVDAMNSSFGSRPSDIFAGIGPAIGPCCYQVRDDVLSPARNAFDGGDGIILAQPDGSQHLDLWEANRRALVEAGIPAANIESAGICTRCHRDRFFSNRAGDKGRFAAMIALAAPAEVGDA